MDRRTKEGYKLRIYIDQIRLIKAMSVDQWVDLQASFPSTERYVSKDMWLSYLEGCAILEAEKLIKTEAA
jgi:hypothetical protein